MLITPFFLFAIGLPLSAASPFQVPSRINLEPRAHPASQDQPSRETLFPSNNFWFGSFDVGSSKNLTLLIDTGFGGIVLNDGVYKPSPDSSTEKDFNVTFKSTNSDGSGTGIVKGTLFNDTVKFGTFETHQIFGSARKEAGESNLIPADGILGLGDPATFEEGSSFFHTLCAQHQVPECRFGLVLGRDQGTQVLGRLDKSLFEGELTTTSILQEWSISADLAFDGKVLEKDITVLLDSGTGTIIIGVDEATSLFRRMNIQYYVQQSEEITTVTGYFPCDQPPSLGLSIPSESNLTAPTIENSKSISHKASVFDIQPDQWAKANNGNHNCTATISGTSAVPAGLWVVGQPFFHGIYIDHNVADGTIGFAKARNYVGGLN